MIVLCTLVHIHKSVHTKYYFLVSMDKYFFELRILINNLLNSGFEKKSCLSSVIGNPLIFSHSTTKPLNILNALRCSSFEEASDEIFKPQSGIQVNL